MLPAKAIAVPGRAAATASDLSDALAADGIARRAFLGTGSSPHINRCPGVLTENRLLPAAEVVGSLPGNGDAQKVPPDRKITGLPGAKRRVEDGALPAAGSRAVVDGKKNIAGLRHTRRYLGEYAGTRRIVQMHLEGVAEKGSGQRQQLLRSMQGSNGFRCTLRRRRTLAAGAAGEAQEEKSESRS